MRRVSAFILAVATIATGGCTSKPPETPPDAVVNLAPEPPPIPPHPTTEDGVLQAFSQAVEQKDLVAASRMLAPELAAELAQMHQQNEQEFWARGQDWVVNAKSGITIATRADDAGKATRWRALVRFGNGQEETVEFTKHDGKLVLAKL